MSKFDHGDGTNFVIGLVILFGVIIPVILSIWAFTIKEIISIFK
jgi:hypothetical protein